MANKNPTITRWIASAMHAIYHIIPYAIDIEILANRTKGRIHINIASATEQVIEFQKLIEHLPDYGTFKLKEDKIILIYEREGTKQKEQSS